MIKLNLLNITDIQFKNFVLVADKKLVPDDKEFTVLQSMVNLRKSGLGYRKISHEIKNKYGKRIYYPQVHKILNRPHNLKLLKVA